MVNSIGSIGFISPQTCLQKTKSLAFGAINGDTEINREGCWTQNNGSYANQQDIADQLELMNKTKSNNITDQDIADQLELMKGSKNVSFGTQQTLYASPQKEKSLGFGTWITDDNDNLIEVEKPSTKQSKSATGNPTRCHAKLISSEPTTPLTSFETQVLANQQKMIGLLGEIKSSVCPEPATLKSREEIPPTLIPSSGATRG